MARWTRLVPGDPARLTQKSADRQRAVHFDVSHASQNPISSNTFRNRYSRTFVPRWQCLREWLLSPRGELPLRQAHHENSARASQYQLANAIGSNFPAARYPLQQRRTEKHWQCRST